MGDLANSLAVLIGMPLYLFGLPISAIMTLITVIEYFTTKNFKGLILFLSMLLAIGLSYIIFDGIIALRVTAILIIAFSLKILFSNRFSLQTSILCGGVVLLATLSFILANNLNNRNDQLLDDVILFTFCVMAPAILARLVIKSFNN